MDYDDIILLWARDPALADLEGLDFGTIARRLGMSKFQAYIHVARASGGQARILLGTYSGDEAHEEALQAVLADPLCAFMTDTILTRQGSHNPASFGTFPRVLGRYSRDLGLFPLEEAVRRMTDYPARRFGLQGVGRVAEGYWADLVAFDPKAIADHTTLQKPDVPPAGVEAVWVSGHLVVRGGQVVDSGKHGRVLRRAG
jgi:N-acyl-D-amino-acid deacylase